ncbi:MAG: hypothetical protein GTO71_07810 [Woeseiaceae bacterium]|nr:hypothetical protein [Woeseiaceae bacterium]NIP20993.1 hypothetical protein [Woeseiaceae bacterium]NIS89973.1 hypothetical protein [Woeseiaceae bacterium]
MNTDSVNRWLTLGANLGVVIGLILLIVELSQNSSLVQAQIHQARSDNYESFMLEIADTEFLLPAYEKFAAAGGPADVSALKVLDSTERERIRRYFQGRLGGYDNLYFQYQQGYIDEEFYSTRIAPSIKRLYPIWLELGLLDMGATSKFTEEAQRIANSN